ncbi:immunoglobulin superfamily member 1-like [Salarias fasciatus]|uniref:immunoglobulin superfamily member 1-like n=1 Tax=Salarias fasciatus TaxID=181472 RepID=UPI001176D6B4|nr:immunoglobulin superfamily member 1-like [Salarias fasciatus]
MTLLMLMLVFLLQNGGIRGKICFYHLYQRPGKDVLLPCLQESLSYIRCSSFTWLYNKDNNGTSTDVRDGEVEKSSPRAARLSLDTNCSLIINNITAEDAGLYTCRYLTDTNWDTQVILNILTISPSSTDTDPNKDGEVTLSCSMFKYEKPCKLRSLRWVDETGAELVGEGDGFKYGGQTNCVSYLTVKLQTEHSRRYTCQYVDGTAVKIEAHYSIVSSVSPTDSTDWSPLRYTMWALRISLLILMMVITALIIRGRGSSRQLRNNRVRYIKTDDGGAVNYENVEQRLSPSTLR